MNLAAVIKTTKFHVYSGAVSSGIDTLEFDVSSKTVYSEIETSNFDYYSVMTSEFDISSHMEKPCIFDGSKLDIY